MATRPAPAARPAPSQLATYRRPLLFFPQRHRRPSHRHSGGTSRLGTGRFMIVSSLRHIAPKTAHDHGRAPRAGYGGLASTRTARTPRSIGIVASTTPEKPPATAEKPPQRRETGPGIVVARLFGIPVYISQYWFVIAGVFILIYANDLASTLHGSTRFIVAAAFVVLLYVSVLIHELSHSLVARGYGLPVRRILLYPLGGFSEIEQEPPTPGREFLVSAAGPALSLVLAAAGYGLMHVVPPGTIG